MKITERIINQAVKKNPEVKISLEGLMEREGTIEHDEEIKQEPEWV